MYSTTIKPKVDVMFNDLRKKVSAIVIESSTSNEAINNVTKLVSSELAARSKSILSDMLFDLSDKLIDTEFLRILQSKTDLLKSIFAKKF